MLNCTGRLVPLVTPLTDDGASLSEVRLSRLVKWNQQAGCDGFVVCSEIGEFATLTNAERKQVLEWVLRDSQNASVLVHISTLTTNGSLDLAQHAGRHGARGVILMPPYYGRYNTEELVMHFRTVTNYSDLAVLVVDPFKVITDEVKAGLSAYPQLKFVGESPTTWEGRMANGTVRTEEFVYEKVEVSPLFGCPSPDDLLTHCREFGRASLMRALYSEVGLEVGPPRPPRQPLRVEALQQARMRAA